MLTQWATVRIGERKNKTQASEEGDIEGAFC
jgi:hypothetical protein